MDSLVFLDTYRAEQAQRERRLAEVLLADAVRAEQRRLAAQRSGATALVRTRSLRRRLRALAGRDSRRTPRTPVRMA